MNHLPASPDYDVLIVGSGIMGAAIARSVRDGNPAARILMVDAGPVIGTLPGQHLHDTPDEEIRRRFAARAAAGNQALYVGVSRLSEDGTALADAEAGMHSLSAFGSDTREMSGSSVSWNVGGMGAHWAAATPWPYGPEVVDFLPADEWDADLETSQRLLRVHPSPYGTTVAGEIVHAALDDVFGDTSDEGRHVQAMPMAVTISETGRLLRTGPSSIFEPLALGGDDNFELRANTLAIRVEYAGSRASGITARDTVTGALSTITAHSTVLAADTMRTPQLLWASGIRPAALGKYLNEHAFLTGRVTVDRERLGITEIPLARDGEWATTATWLPRSGDNQPFQGQIMQSPVMDAATGDATDYAVLLALYIPTEVRAENRIEFSDTETDIVGMPRMTVHFSYSAEDQAMIERARDRQAAAAQRLGEFVPERDSLLLAPGSSLHYTGTVRMGAADDGTSVCNPDGRVWKFDNLYLAGNGVVPTPLTCNSTLTGTITAVRAARSILLDLETATAGASPIARGIPVA